MAKANPSTAFPWELTKAQRKAQRKKRRQESARQRADHAPGPVNVIKFPKAPAEPQTHPAGQHIAHAPKAPRVAATSEDFLKSYAWRQLRMKVLMHYGAKCMCCGATPADGEVMNVDHIKARKTHPHLALEFSNLQVLCGTCNHGKGNWSQTDWRGNLASTHEPVTETDHAALAHLRDMLAG